MAELEIKPTPAMRLRVLGVVIAGIAITMTLVYLLVGGDFLAPRTTLISYMPDATGLTSTSEVRLSGIRIGTVEKIALSNSLDRQRAVEVRLRVLTRYLKGIPSDSQTDIRADTLVGSQFVDIAEGKSPIPIAENGILTSEPVKGAEDRADLIQSLQDRLKQVDSILADVSNPQSGLGQSLLTSNLHDQVLGVLSNLDNGIHSLLNPKSSAGQAFYSLELYNGIRDPLRRLDQTLILLQNDRLFTSDEQYTQALAQIRDVRASLSRLNSKGLLQDDATYRRIERLLADTERTLASVNAGEGRAGSLLANAQLYESLNGSLRSMENFLQDFRVNPRKYLRYKVF